jgi:hypothetical protein
MKIINFTKNISKAILTGVKKFFIVVMQLGIFAFVAIVFFSIVGYISSLFGLVIGKSDNTFADYAFTGYAWFIGSILVAMLTGAVYSACAIIKDIWKRS